MAKIKSIKAREILDSRGNPTVEVEAILENKVKAWASVPSGASTGTHEALELRDGDKKRYNGLGVLKAVNNINNLIAKKIIRLEAAEQENIDKTMLKLDGTANKTKLGANAILGVSMVVARAAAISEKKPLYRYLRDKFFPEEKSWRLPVPMMNIINGGAHADWCMDIQEFMILPHQKNVSDRVRCGAEIFFNLKKLLKGMGLSIAVGDEGGFAPKFAGNEEALKVILKAVKSAGYNAGKDVSLGLDAAASGFYENGRYEMKADKTTRTTDDLIDLYGQWLKKYPVMTIEDGLAEDDWDGWQKLTKKLGSKVILIGDDLFVTNVKRLQQGIDMYAANAILIKLNQIGSVTETVEAIKLAQKNKFKVAVSHRSGETVDDFIADLAVAANAEFLKAGSLSRGERIAKYNRLMEIEEEINL